MKAVDVTVLNVQGDRRTVKAILVADSPPNPLPVNGNGIEGLEPADVFAPLSALLVLDGSSLTVYLADTSGTFQPV